ncbi:Hypothetical protein CINCED_3A022541 [Cinara cedri]|nr:Hypothetical protein CINCED_3A022541 [Cinara cedri]
MESSQETVVQCDVPGVQEVPQQLLSLENHCQLAENPLPTNSPNDTIDSQNISDQNSNSGNPTSVETTDVISQDVNDATETSSAVSTDNSMPPLPPPSKDNKGQPTGQYSADYNMQNYANYNYMYNYNNYYGYPYPQYQWDYNSQQYYQPYQNYYNYNYNANQAQTASSKPPPPPPDAVQLPVEEKPTNKTNLSAVDDSNRYSPTAETDDDDTMKGWSENNKSDGLIEQTISVTTTLANSVLSQTVSSEQIEIDKQKMTKNIENKLLQPTLLTVTQMQPQLVPVVPQTQPYTIPIQQPNYLINPQVVQQMLPSESNELINQHQNVPAQNGKEDSTDKLSKVSSVLGKNQAKKRLMAFSMMKQKLQEQNNSTNDYQNLDVGEGNDVEFVPELNVFQTVAKKKVVTNKKVAKVIKAQQTIEQIEEMKKDELLQGNNAALYQQLLRNGGNEAPILQKLGIESLAEKYSAKIREQDKRLQRHHHHRRRDNARRGHKYRRHSHSKSRSRSKSAEKPKMRALEVKNWKDFINGGFQFGKFRRFKIDETEEMKGKERKKSRTKKRHGVSRSDGKNQNTESLISTETEKENSDQKSCFNILERKKEILKSFEVISLDGECTKDFPNSIIRHTKTKPFLKYSENPSKATCHLQNRQQMLATLLPEIETIVINFLSSIKPKKIKENFIEDDVNSIDDKLLAMMKDTNIYPFKGWWPKTCFIVTQVKEDPNVEVDKDALIITTSKRTKKSRFNNDDDTSLVDLRPTVPSKWDSDYDGSPVADKVVEVTEVPQNLEIINDNVSMVITEEDNLPVVIHQEEAMDTTFDIGKDELKIDVGVNQVIPILSHQSQDVSKLNNEYVEFLKIVGVDKIDENIKNDMSNTSASTVVEMENENNLSIKSNLLQDESAHDESVQGDSVQDESVQDESEEDTSNKTSDESVSLHNVSQRTIDIPFAEHLSSDKKLKKKKKSLHKKSKKMKKKGNKKKRRSKSSSSESSQDSESESDSSSENSMSDTSNSSSIVEKKKKKKKSKDKKKRKDKTNYKKKHKSDKNKKFENEKDSNSTIINLLEKALNVEIKKRPLSDSEGSRQKKKKRKHNKKDDKSNENNEDNLDIVKECLKETFTKLVKNDNDQPCNETTVNKVLKYFNMDKEKEKKNKKSKKSSKRKYDSDISEHNKISKKSKLDNSLKFENIEKKKKSSKKKKMSEKKSLSNNSVSKKKTKKKLKLTTDTSETEDGEESKHKKPQSEEIENFFGQRPNEWNVNNSSMRGVVHHSDTKKNDKSPKKSQLDENSCSSKGNKNKKDENSKKSKNLLLLDKFETGSKQENMGKALETHDDSNVFDNKSKNVIGKIKKNTDLEDNEKNISYTISEQCDKYILKHRDDLPRTMLLSTNNDYIEEADRSKDPNNITKPMISKSLDQNGKKELDDEEVKISKTISDQCDKNMLKHRDNLPQTMLLFTNNDYNEQKDCNKDLNNFTKPTVSKPLDLNDKKELDKEKVKISNTISDQCDKNMLKNRDDLPQTILLSTNNDYNEQKDQNKDPSNFTKPIVSKLLDLNGKNELDDEEVKISNTISDQCDKNMLKHRDGLPQTMLLSTNNDYNEQKNQNKDPSNFTKPNVSKPLDLNDTPPLTTSVKPLISSGESMSYREKVKLNLKKLSTCQYNIPLVFGFASPLNLIESKQLEFEEINKSPKAFKEEVADDSKSLNFVDSPTILPEQSQSKKPNEAKISTPKIDMEANNELVMQNLNRVYSDTYNKQSSTSANIENAEENEQIESNLLEHDSLDLNDVYKTSNDCELKGLEHTLDTTESSSSSDEENNKEFCPGFENTIAGPEITTSADLSNLSKPEQNFDESLNSVQCHNKFNEVSNINNKLVMMSPSLEVNGSDCLHNSSIDLENPQIDNELITQWMSDWSMVVNAPVEINNSNNFRLDNPTIDLQKGKKSRWDEPPIYEQVNYNETISSSYTTKDFDNEYRSSIIDNLEEQNCTSQSPLINEPSNYNQEKHNQNLSNSYTTKDLNNENLSSNIDNIDDDYCKSQSELINESPNYEQEKYNNTISSSYTTKVYNNENCSSNVGTYEEEPNFTNQSPLINEPPNYEQEKYNNTLNSSYTTKVYNNENLSSNVDNFNEEYFISQLPLTNEPSNYEHEKFNDTISNSYTTKGFNNEHTLSNVDNFEEQHFISQLPLINEPSIYEHEKYNDTISSSYTTKGFNNEHTLSNVDNFEQQHFISQSSLINCVTDVTEYNYSDNWGSEYVDHTQPYHEYSCPPPYSEIQTIEHDRGSFVDYNMYENFDPSYDFYNENDKTWESIDTIVHPIIGETSTMQQVGDVFEMSSNDIYNTETEFPKNEAEFNGNITTIMPTEDESVEEENPESPCLKSPSGQFLKLFHQHFDHYNQNPIKYSLSEPILDHVAEINTIVPEKSPIQENSDSNNIDDIPIPSRERAYSSLIQDDNTTIYLTNDNYLAYCAIDDKCMVHIAVHTSNINGIDDEVRHCFNVYQNGRTVEYWLHADLIPFVVPPSDGELGVFTNAEEATVESDSSQEDNDDDDVNDDIIEGEWNLVEAKNDYWLNIQEMYENARVFKKYGYGNRVDQAVIPEENLSNSSDDDSYESDCSDSDVQTCSIENKNIGESTILESLIVKDSQNMSNIAVDINTAGNEQIKNVTPCTVVSTKTEHDENVTSTDQLMLNKNTNTNENIEEEDLNLKIKTEYSENILNQSINEEDNGQELDVPSNKEIPVEELMRMNTIVKQQILVQSLKMRSKENIQVKLPDTELVQYSDNMEVVKHPFLGLFQPPTFSILSKVRNGDEKDVSKLSKHVTFADGIHPGNIQATSPTHDKASRSMSPPPLKKLMRETLKLKHSMYPLNRSKIRVKLNMLKKKVAKVLPVVKDPTSSSVIEYYIRRRRLSDLPIAGTFSHTVETDNSRRSHNTYVRSRNRHRSILRQHRATREVTPVPSEHDSWSDNVI